MPNTYTQVYVQMVFAVQGRISLIHNDWKDDFYAYIIGLIENRHHKVLAIGGMSDHIHIFVSMQPNQSLSNLVQEVKRASSLWVNEKHFVRGNFVWQEGYGAFSYSKSQIDNVVQFIHNQEQHHHKRTFLEEYELFLKNFGIQYDVKYIFKPIEDD